MQPYTYLTMEAQNFFNRQPSTVKGIFNSETQHYKRLLYNEVYSRYEFGLPKNWALNWFRLWLFQFGSIGAIYTNRFGWLPLPYGIRALDVQYQPRELTFSSPMLESEKIGIVGINCCIIKCFDDFYGFDHIVTRYAEMLAQCDRNINVNLITTMTNKVFAAKNKKQADDFKESIAKATQGEPVVFELEDGFEDVSIRDILGDAKADFVADKTMILKRLIVNEFLTYIGLNNANIDKRERLNGDEVNANNEEVKSIASVVLENLQKGFEELRTLTGLPESEVYAKFRDFGDKEGNYETYTLRD